MKYNKDQFNQVGDSIKQRVTIPVVWEKLYNTVPKRWNACKCPWREDKHPSFWVSNDGQRWQDRASGVSGDVFDFYKKVVGCDARQAFIDLLAMAGGEAGLGTTTIAPTQITQEPKLQFHPPLRVPTSGELSAISALRSIAVDGLKIAVARGFLWTAKIRDCLAFVITDKSLKCYLARRMDGNTWENDAKSILLPGSTAKWAIGCIEASDYPVIALCEGGPDFLAAFGHAWASGVEDRVAPVCMTSSGISIPDDALLYFSGKRVRIFAHNDDPGRRAYECWKARLDGIAAKVDRYDFGRLIKNDGSPVKDLNDLLMIDYDCWEVNQQRVEAVMSQF